jgi:hypothetical protein
MSEETVKAFEELAHIEQNIEKWRGEISKDQKDLDGAKLALKNNLERKRELLKVVKVVRVRKPKPEPKPRKERADKGQRRRKALAKGASQIEASSADSQGEPQTIDPKYMQPETAG